MHLQVKEMKVVSSKNFLTKLYHHPPDIGKLLIFPKDGGVDYENQFWSSIAQCQLLKHLTEEPPFPEKSFWCFEQVFTCWPQLLSFIYVYTKNGARKTA